MSCSNALLVSLWRVYSTTTLAYGFARAVTWAYDGNSRYYNKKTGEFELKEMLLVDKIGRVANSTISAVFIWPILIGEDLTRLECAVKGKDPAEYKYSR